MNIDFTVPAIRTETAPQAQLVSSSMLGRAGEDMPEADTSPLERASA